MAIKVTKREVDKKPGQSGGIAWSRKQKYALVTSYLLTGNLMLSCKLQGIPHYTARDWKTQDWWKEYEDEIREAQRTETKTKLGNLAMKAMDVVADRLENGDFIYDQKTGVIKRKPINAHVANRIMNDSFDKNILIEKLQTEKVQERTSEEIRDRLTNLAEEFKKYAQKNAAPKLEGVIDVVPIEEPKLELKA